MKLRVKAIRDCKDNHDNVLMSKDECGTAVSFVPFQTGEIHAVIIKTDMSIVSIDTNKLLVEQISY